MTAVPETKRCSKCGEVKPADAFPIYRAWRLDGTVALGVQSRCRTCVAGHNRAYARAVRGGFNPRRKPPGDTKKCSACGQTKPRAEFYLRRRRRADGTLGYRCSQFCRPCSYKDSIRRRRAKAAPQIWPKTEVCEVCGERHKSGKDLAFDHCHSAGVHRGWLCDFCNTGIGLFLDNPARLKAAVVYLERFDLMNKVLA